MSKVEFYNMTEREYYLRVIGKERLEISEWSKLRYLAYPLYRPENQSLFEFHPLPGDPTKEEIVAARNENAIHQHSKFNQRNIEAYLRHKSKKAGREITLNELKEKYGN